MAKRPNNADSTESPDIRKPRREPKPRASAVDVPANAIEFGEAGPKATASGGSFSVGRGAKSEGRAKRGKENKPPDNAAAEPSVRTARASDIPDTVRERFIQIGSSFFFPDGAEAFTDHGRRVTTRSENAVVIQSMVAIAEARSAGSIAVSGTEFFRKEAWFAARLAGLEVRGYKPTELEQERLVRALARRRGAGQDGLAMPNETRPRETESQEIRKPNSPPAARDRPPAEGEFIAGRLVDHGPAPYQHQPKQPMSYYARIETERGDREIWGVDLERAFRQSLSTPGLGDEVGVRAIGRDPVMVRAPRFDSEGKEVGQSELAVHRNQWSVEKMEFLKRRSAMAEVFRDAAVNAAEGVRQFPELEGSYLQLQLARAGAGERITSLEARAQFVDHLRGHLARTIEQGQSLEPVRLKARGGPEPDKVQDLDYSPTR